MFGLLGFDYGWGLDKTPAEIANKGYGCLVLYWDLNPNSRNNLLKFSLSDT